MAGTIARPLEVAGNALTGWPERMLASTQCWPSLAWYTLQVGTYHRDRSIVNGTVGFTRP